MLWLSRRPEWQRSREFETTTRTSTPGLGSRGVADNSFGDSDDEGDADDIPGKVKTRVVFQPTANTTHTIYYKGHWLRVRRGRKNDGSGCEMLSISVVARNNSILKQLVLQAKREYEAEAVHRIQIYFADSHGCWRWTDSRHKRPMSSIVLNPGVKEMLLADTKDFLKSEKVRFTLSMFLISMAALEDDMNKECRTNEKRSWLAHRMFYSATAFFACSQCSFFTKHSSLQLRGMSANHIITVVRGPRHPLPQRVPPPRCSRIGKEFSYPRHRRGAYARHLRRIAIVVLDKRQHADDAHGARTRAVYRPFGRPGRGVHKKHIARRGFDGKPGFEEQHDNDRNNRHVALTE